MDLGIKGKKAIINGGSAGMGKGSALALAKEGVDLYISARGEKRLEETCEEIVKATGVSVKPIIADHSSDEGRGKVVDHLAKDLNAAVRYQGGQLPKHAKSVRDLFLLWCRSVSHACYDCS